MASLVKSRPAPTVAGKSFQELMADLRELPQRLKRAIQQGDEDGAGRFFMQQQILPSKLAQAATAQGEIAQRHIDVLAVEAEVRLTEARTAHDAALESLKPALLDMEKAQDTLTRAERVQENLRARESRLVDTRSNIEGETRPEVLQTIYDTLKTFEQVELDYTGPAWYDEPAYHVEGWVRASPMYGANKNVLRLAYEWCNLHRRR